MPKPRIVCTIAARMTSTRLPGKILKPILGRPALELMLERVRRAPELDEIVVATTINGSDDPVAALSSRLGLRVFRGSEHDVLGRIAGAARENQADILVELTSDCLAIDPLAISQCIQEHLKGGADYTSNVLKRSYPVGMDTQVISMSAFDESDRLATTEEEREHVGLFIYRRPQQYRLRDVFAGPDSTCPDLHLTLDTADDYRMFEALFGGLYSKKPAFTTPDILAFLKEHPKVASLNHRVQRKPSASEYFAQVKKSP